MEGPRVTKDFKRLVKKAGLPKMRFHDLRHLCASLLVAQGVPATVVKEILGHSHISLTLNTYTHLYESERADAGAKIEDLLAG